MIRKLFRCLVAVVIAPFFLLVVLPFYSLMDYLHDTDFYVTTEAFSDWAGWLTWHD